MKRKLQIVLIGLTFIAVSCNKATTTTTTTKTSLLTSSPWKVKSITPSDVSLPCLLDDVVTINSDGTLTYSDLGTSCGGAATLTGTWDFKSSETILHWLYTGVPPIDQNNTIVKLDATTMILSNSGGSATVTVTYEH